MNNSARFFLLLAGLALAFSLVIPTGVSAADDPGPENDPGQNHITDVDFWKDEQGYLYVSIKGPDIPLPVVKTEDEARLEALVPGFRTPLPLVRIYRLDDFKAGIKSLFIQNTAAGTMLVWTWNEKIPYQVSAGSETLTYRFDHTAGRDVRKSRSEQEDAVVTSLSPEPSPEDDFLEFNTIFPGMKTEYTGDLISIDLQNAEVEYVIRLITSITDYNIILDEDVRGRISLRLIEVPWDQALDLVLIQKNLGMVHRGNIIRITTAQKLEAERDQARRAREAQAQARESMRQLEPLEREFIQINYSRADEILPQIRDFLSERGKVTHDARTNTLIVQDTPSHIRETKALLDNLDRPERQVSIEARVVYATEEFRRGLGIKWNYYYPEENSFAPHRSMLSSVNYSSMNFPRMADDFVALAGEIQRKRGNLIFTLDAELRLGESQNISKTISSPSITTHNNQEAYIEQGIQIPYITFDEAGQPHTKFQKATLKLTVTPQITPDNMIMLDIEVKDDKPVAFGDQTAIENREMQTKLMVADGETAILGGIHKTISEEQESRVPGVGNIPLLGWLFKNQFKGDTKNELLIFIRPEIL